MTTFLLWVTSFVLADLAWRRRNERAQLAGFGLGAVICLVSSLAVLPNLLYLGKVAGRLAMPVGLIWAGLGAFAAFQWTRRNRRQTVLAVAAFVGFSLAGNLPLAGWLVASLESAYVERDAFTGGPLDAVFVLGGSTAQSHSGAPRLADSGDRLLTAARVFHQREVAVLVTSGSSIPGLGIPRDVASEAADILTDMGVPKSQIVVLAAPKNSSQEIDAYQKLVEERGWQRIGLITSAWHLRRVEKLARRAGLEAEPIPADFRGAYSWDGLLSVIPDAGGFRNMQRGCWEYLGAAVGR